jgi:MoaA/NifB/PqqE/SkfB family radical SAM enzyme
MNYKKLINQSSGLIKHAKIVSHSPFLLGRIAKGYFNANILKKDVLRSVELAITFKCQAKCDFCYSDTLYDKSRSNLTLQEIKELWKECRKLGVIHINLTGGEPMMRPDWDEIIQVLSPKSSIVSMVTNGHLLNEKNVLKAKKSGLRYLQVSIDSANPETHDRSRKIEGLFKTALNGVRLAKKHGIAVSLSTVVTNENAKDGELQKVIQLAEREKVFVLLNLAAMAGKWQENKKIVLDGESKRIVTQLRNNPYVRQNTMYNFRLKEGCPAGLEKVYVTSYGDVTPCTLTHISYGNIRNKSFTSIVTEMRKNIFYRQQSVSCLRCENKDYFKSMIEPLADLSEAGMKMPIPIENHPYFSKS